MLICLYFEPRTVSVHSTYEAVLWFLLVEITKFYVDMNASINRMSRNKKHFYTSHCDWVLFTKLGFSVLSQSPNHTFRSSCRSWVPVSICHNHGYCLCLMWCCTGLVVIENRGNTVFSPREDKHTTHSHTLWLYLWVVNCILLQVSVYLFDEKCLKKHGTKLIWSTLQNCSMRFYAMRDSMHSAF